MLFEIPTVAADVHDYWDYAAITGDFQDVTTVDYLLGDFAGAQGPRMGAVVAIVPEPVSICLLGLGSLTLMRRKRK